VFSEAIRFHSVSSKETDSQITMRLSRYFLPILRETPKEAKSSPTASCCGGTHPPGGRRIYAWLPLGFRVLKKIEQIVRRNRIVPAPSNS